MTVEPDPEARRLHAAGDEALTDASFCTGDFAAAERLFGEALAQATRAGDRAGEAGALGGLGRVRHLRNVATLAAGGTLSEADIAAEEELLVRALALWRETGDAAGTGRALFDVSLVFQVLRRDWAAAMRYLWPAVGLAEAVEEGGDAYGRSEIHRHLGFYYLLEDVRPREAVRQFTHSLALRERIGDSRLIPSALVVLARAELARGNAPQAVALLTRAVTAAHRAALLPWRIQDAEETLRTAKAAVAARLPARPPWSATPSSARMWLWGRIPIPRDSSSLSPGRSPRPHSTSGASRWRPRPRRRATTSSRPRGRRWRPPARRSAAGDPASARATPPTRRTWTCATAAPC